eukprot:scaffold2536_cov169-Amphora_coffeaeformis.AAC.31
MTRRKSCWIATLVLSTTLNHQLLDRATGFAIIVPHIGVTPTHHSQQPPQLRSPCQASRTTCSKQRNRSFRLAAKGAGDDEEDDDDDDDDDPIDLDDEADWRSFRAKLVMGENAPTPPPPPPPSSSSSSSATTTSSIVEDDFDGIGALFEETPASSTDSDSITANNPTMLQGMTPLDPSQWAYESGKIIEQGAVILGGVEQDFGFGLRQQYFHKAAILVLEHEDSTFTKGIILNRPTDLVLEDDVNPGVKWRVWFGGDVQGIVSGNPSIVCLHSMKSNRAVEASISVMKDIQWTTFENAKKLVKAGEAKSTDFWVFVGYAGWAPGQLMGELNRRSWYMVATDSGTLLKELARQGAGADPRDAGLETWDLLMNMIGRQKTAKEHSGGFDDLMLKEWALKHLLSTEAGGGAGLKTLPPEGPSQLTGKKLLNPLEGLLQRNDPFKVGVGSVLRASSADRSPFLLENQELHKSIVLIILDDENISIGAILNRPVTRGLDIDISEKETGKSSRIVLPLRFGGQFSVKGSDGLLWLHCNPSLRLARIGSPLGGNEEGIWKCTADDVVSAVTKGLATPQDFFVVTGVTVWQKAGAKRGIQGEVQEGRFEVIPDKNIPKVWESLAKQEVLSTMNLSLNLAAGEEAWTRGGEGIPPKKKNGGSVPIGGLGEGFDEDDDSLVFKSDVKVSNLSDDALTSWISTFLLGAPFSEND